jgi:ribokinase
LITRGKHGVSFVEDGELMNLEAPKVDVVDTTGAGDCFNAAFCFGLASGWEWERSELLLFEPLHAPLRSSELRPACQL